MKFHSKVYFLFLCSTKIINTMLNYVGNKIHLHKVHSHYILESQQEYNSHYILGIPAEVEMAALIWMIISKDVKIVTEKDYCHLYTYRKNSSLKTKDLWLQNTVKIYILILKKWLFFFFFFYWWSLLFCIWLIPMCS